MLLLAAVLWIVPSAAPAPVAPAGEVQLTARLLRPDGEPLAGERVRWVLLEALPDGDDIAGEYGFKETDAAGRLALSARGDTFAEREDPIGLTLLIERKDGDAYHVERSLPDPVEEKLELGDVTLERAPIMVFGRVLDPAGQPVPDAVVSCSGVCDWALPEDRPALQLRYESAELKTDAEGRFELRGLDRGIKNCSRREVRASSPAFPYTRWHPFGGSASEVVLRLPEPALIHGRIMTAEGVDPTSFRVDAFYEAESAPDDWGRAVKPERDGSFTLRHAAEPCSLVLWLDSRADREVPDPSPDVVLGGVVPGGDQVAWDLRALRLYELVVLDPDGQPAASPDLIYSSAGKSLHRLFSGEQRPPVHRILSFDHPLTVRVEEEGCRTASVTLDVPRGELKLAPGIDVRISIPNLPDLGEGGFLAMELTLREGPSVRMSPEATGSVDRHGAGQVVAPEPGTYRVRLRHERRTATEVWSGVSSSWTTPLEIDVDDKESQTFKLKLPEKLVEALRREAGERR